MSSRRSRGRLATLAALAGGLGASLSALPVVSAGATSPSASALVKASLDAGSKQSSVHYVVHSAAGKQSVSLVADASQTKGNQSIVLRDGSKTGHVSGRLVNGSVYFEGDATGLTSYLGMPASLAPKYVDKWIVWTSSDPSYSSVAKNFQVATAIGQISLKAPMSIGRRATVNGTPSVNIVGTTSSLSAKGKKGPATLAVSTSKTHLPVRFAGRGNQKAGKASGTVTFSKWNQDFSVTAPTGAIPVATITG